MYSTRIENYLLMNIIQKTQGRYLLNIRFHTMMLDLIMSMLKILSVALMEMLKNFIHHFIRQFQKKQYLKTYRKRPSVLLGFEVH